MGEGRAKGGGERRCGGGRHTCGEAAYTSPGAANSPPATQSAQGLNQGPQRAGAGWPHLLGRQPAAVGHAAALRQGLRAIEQLEEVLKALRHLWRAHCGWSAACGS